MQASERAPVRVHFRRIGRLFGLAAPTLDDRTCVTPFPARETLTSPQPDSPSAAQFSSDVWLATGIMTAVPANLCLEGGRLTLTLPNGDVVFDAAHADARATFSALHFDAAFSVVVADETFRISLVAPLPDPAGIGAARRVGRRWRTLLAHT